ncbi:uncharacterized protein LOC114313272 isoform X2 [Camellia sinensis]|uniref:uncharacterized protein LOC114313272 isoform X2 n=1 Tax=Camellia sinensis TaxID=4442 RepID=UPI001036112B|nr:uncharacterized protein LOC114313272 isoform X2 [Camellia sinensis]
MAGITVFGMIYYRRALMLQSFLERRSLGGKRKWGYIGRKEETLCLLSNQYCDNGKDERCLTNFQFRTVTNRVYFRDSD